MIVALIASGLTNFSNGQSLSDWQNALSTAKSNRSSKGWAGLNSIPYSNIRQSAESEQSILNDLKLVQYACLADNHGTSRIRSSIKGMEDNVSKVTNESDKTKVNEELTKQKALLQDLIQKAQQRENFAQRVVEARRKVRDQVNNAISKAKSETDATIKPIALELAGYWENDINFHRKAIEDAERAVVTCKECGEGRL